MTPKQEKFALAVAGGMSQADAYRHAYDAGRMKPETVHRNACALAADNKVSAMIDALKDRARARHDVSVDDLLCELEAARQSALQATPPQCSAAVAATMGKAKLLGLDKQVLEHTGPGGGPVQVTRIELVELKPLD